MICFNPVNRSWIRVTESRTAHSQIWMPARHPGMSYFLTASPISTTQSELSIGFVRVPCKTWPNPGLPTSVVLHAWHKAAGLSSIFLGRLLGHSQSCRILKDLTLCYIVGPCRLSILYIVVVVRPLSHVRLFVTS